MSETLKLLKHRYPTAQTFKFGDSVELSAALLALVRSGKKVATCGAVRDFENGEPMPQIGRRDIALHWDDTPALVIETVELIQCRFDEVTEAMALAEGEDDSLDGWRRGHRAYFERNGGFSPDMQILWERFLLVEDFG
ncbi:MAG: ASCH domain-containing protein [Tritonibacter mobilis]|nr:ASCH domain-containing protein [Tritonibacter mobilis]